MSSTSLLTWVIAKILIVLILGYNTHMHVHTHAQVHVHNIDTDTHSVYNSQVTAAIIVPININPIF